MILYAIIMFATAVLFSVIALLIYKGKVELIHDYHQKNVTDKSAYGKAFGKAMAVIAGAMAVSGACSLFGEAAGGYAVGILFFGLFVGIAAIIYVQKKYNGGIF